jgi:peptide subunit release factor 1 (eRF1)
MNAVKAIKSNMKDQILTNDRKVLHCPECNVDFSGNKGDYWNLPETHIFRCLECGVEMELVTKITTVVYV